jgi:hypothetical protein
MGSSCSALRSPIFRPMHGHLAAGCPHCDQPMKLVYIIPPLGPAWPAFLSYTARPAATRKRRRTDELSLTSALDGWSSMSISHPSACSVTRRGRLTMISWIATALAFAFIFGVLVAQGEPCSGSTMQRVATIARVWAVNPVWWPSSAQSVEWRTAIGRFYLALTARRSLR